MANPDPNNPTPAPVPDPENPPAEPTPSRRERLNAHMHEPSNMGHVWGITFALFVVAIVSVISFSRISSLREDVDSLKATSATKAEVKKQFEDFGTKVANAIAEAIANSETRTNAKIASLDTVVTKRVSDLDKMVANKLAAMGRKVSTTSTALDSLTTRVENVEDRPSLFTPEQLKRLRDFADTPVTPAAK